VRLTAVFDHATNGGHRPGFGAQDLGEGLERSVEDEVIRVGGEDEWGADMGESGVSRRADGPTPIEADELDPGELRQRLVRAIVDDDDRRPGRLGADRGDSFR
jgi:hypothetical protein